jgi:DNA-binding NtrC family response regulator
MTINENILVVDDDPGWRSTLEQLLKGEGYGVILTKDYSTALDRILRAGAWFAMADLTACVVDLRFAGSPVEENYDGLGLLAVCQIRGIPTIVVSGFLTRELKNQLHDQFQVTACFDKLPFIEQEFLATVREALAPRRRVKGHALLEVKETAELEFQTKLQKLVDTIIDYYGRAHTMINDKQRERRIARGRPCAEDEALWEQQIRDLDQKYSTTIDRLNQVNTIAELDSLHTEIVKECLRWVSG